MTATILRFPPPRRQRGHMDLSGLWWLMLAAGALLAGFGALLVFWAAARL